MEFPSDVLRIIYDYSKPLTRPNWREGALHVIAFKQSIISATLKCYVRHSNGLFYLINVYPELYDTDTLIFNIIHKYGEHIFYYHNFYYYIKKYMLKKTNYFNYNNKTNEWIYTKRNCSHFWCNKC